MTGEAGAAFAKLSRGRWRKIQLDRQCHIRRRNLSKICAANSTTSEPERAAALEWNISLGDEILEIDPQILQEAFLEISGNAFTHGRAEGPLIFAAAARRENDRVHFARTKERVSTARLKTGARALCKMCGSGHYGLGLFRARSII